MRDAGCQNNAMVKGESFQPVVLGDYTSTCKKMNLDPYLKIYIRINSK